MNRFYLVTGSSVLTDSIFFAYGGAANGLTGTAAQRNAAYAMAETQAAYEINTPLVPTTFTGTFNWQYERLQLPWGRVQSILSVTALHEVYCTCEAVEISGCAWIIDPDNGVVDLRQCGGLLGSAAGCVCAWAQGYHTLPKQVRIIYVAGLPAGQAAAYPGALQGLTIAAGINLQAIVDCGFDGDPQISSFSDTGYSETRTGLKMTQFGGSPRANFAARMLEPLKFRGAVKIR